jgi:hypothetical protein
MRRRSQDELPYDQARGSCRFFIKPVDSALCDQKRDETQFHSSGVSTDARIGCLLARLPSGGKQTSALG